jgi:primosomal protein N'
MYVIDVIPLSRTAPSGVLSYRSRAKLPQGSIVHILLRKKATQGIVVACVPVAEAKSMLKRANFMLRASEPALAGAIPESIMNAVREVSEYYAASLGSVLAALFSEQVKSDVPLVFPKMERSEKGFTEVRIEQSIEARVESYSALIEASVASKRAVMLVVPTLAEVEFWKQTFNKQKPLVLSGALSGFKRKQALEFALDATGLVIATPSFSWSPISSLSTIIIDRVSAGTYTLPKRPYINIASALRALASSRELTIAYGDYPLPLEYRADSSTALEFPLTTPTIVHDARKAPDEKDVAKLEAQEGSWRALPAEVLASIRAELEAGGHVVVLASRAGYAPAVVCRDCGQAVVDERGMQLSFTQAGGKRLLRSSDGKTVIDAKIVCARCGSWNLLPLGVGMERVAEELALEFPESIIIQAPTESLRTKSAATKTLEESEKPGSIVVGTESLLPWLLLRTLKHPKAPLAVIASADSLLALPFWRSRERFVRLSYFFAGLSEKLIVVTRKPDDTAVEAVRDSARTTFFTEEASLRKILNYPPHGTLIVLHAEASPEGLEALQVMIVEALGATQYSVLPDRAVTGRVMRRTTVISLPEGAWPDPELSQKLQQLPPNVRLAIDPESLW